MQIDTVKILSQANYNSLTDKPQTTLHFVEVPTYVTGQGTGYIRFSNGFTIQRGSFTRTTDAKTVTLPISMTTSTYSVVMNLGASSSYTTYNADTRALYASSKTATKFIVQCNANATNFNTITWIVIGY